MDDDQRPKDPDSSGEDAELHAWLDGDLTEEQRSAAARRLASDPLRQRRLETLRRFEGWLEESRPVVPLGLAERTRRAAEDERAVSASRLRRFVERFLPSPGGRLVWVPAAALAVVAVALLVRFEVIRSHRLPASGSPSESASAAEVVPYTFRFPAADARQVCLVGSFNLWTVCENPLRESTDGTWSVTLDLPRGRYEYMFVVDGEWRTDPSAPVHVDDDFGRENSVLLL
jgi:hypothetical protein